MNTTQFPAIGKDTIYICQTSGCENREKEFSLPDRNYKYCSKCGGISVKATLTDSYNYITATTITQTDGFTKDVSVEEDYD